ncbi:c-type cytochrome, partial [Paraburkholderia sp. SIMBA_030]|uniref:c-type cytochrome n=1 Tax=Paraburkholderia sp. SIMBA_030 TaxID=3085773 RepID=UPI003978982E
VYNAVCHTCHTAGLLGSPIFGDTGAWGPRIAKGKDTLYTHAINGFNAMPAKGGADIPDEEVQNAVDYMVAEAS